MEIIRSKDNPKVKYLSSISDRRKASREHVIFLEGKRLVSDAVGSGIEPLMLVYSEEGYRSIGCVAGGGDIIVLSDSIFAKVANTVNPQGIIMVAKEPDHEGEIPFEGPDSLYVVLENLQDPGNMGTIIRLADAMGFTAVILLGNNVDIYNEKVIRASMGSVFHIPAVKTDLAGLKAFLEDNKVTSYAMHLKGELLDESRLSLPAAYFIGNEGSGLTVEASELSDKMLKIPMKGKAESLNAASAASIIGYELSKLRKE